MASDIQPIFIIAEVGQNHDGSLGTAHSFIDAVSLAGATAVKFQAHIAAAESTPEDRFRVDFSFQDKNRYDYWKRMEFTVEQWCDLKSHAEDKGLEFLCTPFSLEAAEMLNEIGLQQWKIGSGDLTFLPLLRYVAKTQKHTFLSTGMATYAEISEAISIFGGESCPLTLMQCTSAYPSSPELLGLNVIQEMRERFDLPVGFSDHSGKIFPSIAASVLGATAIEVHVTLSQHAFGPDISSSITIEDLDVLCTGVNFLHRSIQNPINKDAIAATLNQERRLFGRAAIATRDIAPGEQLGASNIRFVKPSLGYSVSVVEGAQALNKITKGTVIKRDDFA